MGLLYRKVFSAFCFIFTFRIVELWRFLLDIILLTVVSTPLHRNWENRRLKGTHQENSAIWVGRRWEGMISESKGKERQV